MPLSKPKYSVVIADSQFLVTESLKIVVAQTSLYQPVVVAENYDHLLQLLASQKVDLLITDHATFDYPSIHAIDELINNHPKTSILILTNQVLKPDFNELTLAGVKNIICKTTDRSELLMAMEATMRKKKFYSEEVLDLMMENPVSRNKTEALPQLTTTEAAIVKMIAEGMTTKEMAAKKHISFHTVMTHRKNIFRKLNVNSSSELIMFAIKAGWIDNIEYYI
ncbi:response regulator transcription factor [Geofilum sp. OHC36d9]|uniref:response regulator transcription factor n=1 Tax=Geofilum sp. OHC36d9 TaxID=3458413 RepID=UPI0040345D4E